MIKTDINQELENYKLCSCGNVVFDQLLNGGFEHKTLTTIYGPAGSGKTNVVLILSKNVLEQGKKVIFIDTESSFSIERFKQIGGINEKNFDSLVIFKPKEFKDQKDLIYELNDILDSNVGLVVVDSISMLYRIENSKSGDISTINKEFSLQISFLVDISVKYDIPVVVTSQVYSDFEKKDSVNLVGGDLLRYSSKCLIELKSGRNGLRQAIIKKHRSISQDKSILFKIISDGIENGE